MAASETDAATQTRLHQADGKLLRAIEDALTRIRHESFGIYEECWQPISKAPGSGALDPVVQGGQGTPGLSKLKVLVDPWILDAVDHRPLREFRNRGSAFMSRLSTEKGAPFLLH